MSKSKEVKQATQEYLDKLKKVGLGDYKVFIQIFPESEIDNKIKYGGFRYPKREIFSGGHNIAYDYYDYMFFGCPTQTLK